MPRSPSGFVPSNAQPSIAEVLLNDVRPADAVRPVPGARNLSLITGSPALARMDSSLRNAREPERRLADVLKPLAPQFDTIVLDSPAGYSLLARSVPQTADQLVVPIRAEYLSLESLAQFLTWYRDLQPSRKGTARLAGILLTMVDYRRQATQEIVDIIRLHNRRGVFATEIPQDPRVAESPSHGLPVVDLRADRAWQPRLPAICRRARHAVRAPLPLTSACSSTSRLAPTATVALGSVSNYGHQTLITEIIQCRA